MEKVLSLAACLVWPGIIALPLYLTHDNNFAKIFPRNWFDLNSIDLEKNQNQFPLALGLCLGLFAVVVGQIFTIIYFSLRCGGYLGEIKSKSVQKSGPVQYEFLVGLYTHLSQPEGFVMLGAYLIGTWMFRIMPSSYYLFSGGINWIHVLLQLLIQDVIQTIFHLLEHRVNSAFYRMSHKPHHRFTNPKLFDAFNGSATDTFCMILLPLAITAQLVHTNVWSYMTFGTLYANWLVLIHSEYCHVWDYLFQQIGFGTAADHHVHHRLFVLGYVVGTYMSPVFVKLFNTYDESQTPASLKNQCSTPPIDPGDIGNSDVKEKSIKHQ